MVHFLVFSADKRLGNTEKISTMNNLKLRQDATQFELTTEGVTNEEWESVRSLQSLRRKKTSPKAGSTIGA